MLDIHSHILPGMDDGAKTFDDSILLLKQLMEHGVDTVVATPHFYPDSAILDEYVAARQAAIDKLSALSKEAGDIKILPGAEVLYFSGMGGFEDIKKLTFPGGGYLLLELMGLKKIDGKVISDIVNIRENFGIMPIIAHVERYCRYKGYKELIALIKNGDALCQINATFFFSRHETRAVKKLMKAGLVQFAASDCHNPVKRPVYLKNAFERLKKISPEQTEIIIKNTENIERELLAVYDKQFG